MSQCWLFSAFGCTLYKQSNLVQTQAHIFSGKLSLQGHVSHNHILLRNNALHETHILYRTVNVSIGVGFLQCSYMKQISTGLGVCKTSLLELSCQEAHKENLQILPSRLRTEVCKIMERQLQMASRCSLMVREAHFLRWAASYLDRARENLQSKNGKKEHLLKARGNHTQLQ